MNRQKGNMKISGWIISICLTGILAVVLCTKIFRITNFGGNTANLYDINHELINSYDQDSNPKAKRLSFKKADLLKNKPLLIKPQTSNSVSNDEATNNIDFTFVYETAGLPMEVRKSFYQSSDKYLHEIISDLVKIHVLDKNDLKTLNYKIKITYQQSCEITEGSFNVVKNKKTGRISFDDIELIIAYCDKNDTPEKEKRHVQQILDHEIGHYVYFFKDDNPSKFSEICRDNGQTNCLPQEFVTKYANKSPEEDYAESFAYWHLYSMSDFGNNNEKSLDNTVNKKMDYFQELFTVNF